MTMLFCLEQKMEIEIKIIWELVELQPELGSDHFSWDAQRCQRSGSAAPSTCKARRGQRPMGDHGRPIRFISKNIMGLLIFFTESSWEFWVGVKFRWLAWCPETCHPWNKQPHFFGSSFLKACGDQPSLRSMWFARFQPSKWAVVHLSKAEPAEN